MRDMHCFVIAFTVEIFVILSKNVLKNSFQIMTKVVTVVVNTSLIICYPVMSNCQHFYSECFKNSSRVNIERQRT